MKILSLNKSYSDKEIVAHISEGTKEEGACLKQLYKEAYKYIVSFVMKNNGKEADGKEVVQNAIIVLYEKIKKGDFTLNAKLTTYLFSIAKNQWYAQLKKQNKFLYMEEEQSEVVYGTSFQNENDIIEEDEVKKQFVISIMNQLKADCKEILVYSVYQNYSMKEIAEMMDFKNEQIARNKKSKCLGYFKNLVLKASKADKLTKIMAS